MCSKCVRVIIPRVVCNVHVPLCVWVKERERETAHTLDLRILYVWVKERERECVCVCVALAYRGVRTRSFSIKSFASLDTTSNTSSSKS